MSERRKEAASRRHRCLLFTRPSAAPTAVPLLFASSGRKARCPSDAALDTGDRSQTHLERGSGLSPLLRQRRRCGHQRRRRCRRRRRRRGHEAARGHGFLWIQGLSEMWLLVKVWYVHALDHESIRERQRARQINENRLKKKKNS